MKLHMARARSSLLAAIVIQESFSLVNFMVMAGTTTMTEATTRGSIKTVRGVAMGLAYNRVAVVMRASTKMISLMVVVYISGLMVDFMMGSGETDKCAAKVNIRNQTQLFMKESGKTGRKMVMES